jgi:Raf kinase inhibitor-like YbhB/YbcL family protein
VGDWPTFELTSTAFASGAPIPARHTCDGEDLSPPLSWEAPPDGTVSLALDLTDPIDDDTVVTHWLFWNLDGATTALPEGVAPDATDLVQGATDMGDPGYRGPCPPAAHDPHTYELRLWAVDTSLGLPPTADRAELYDALDGHIVGEGRLDGTYDRAEPDP